MAERLASFEHRAAAHSGKRIAAVALVLMPDVEGRPSFVLTQRAFHLPRHRGQYALPGGRLDAGETPEEAALRELEEEVGLDLPPQSILGRLDDFATRSGWVMTPVVVWGEAGRKLKPDPGEVAHAYLVPFAELEGPEVPTLTPAGSGAPVLSLPLVGTQIFAPTAAILYQASELLFHGRATRVAHYEQPRFAWR